MVFGVRPVYYEAGFRGAQRSHDTVFSGDDAVEHPAAGEPVILPGESPTMARELAAMLAWRVCLKSGEFHALPFVFIGNVGEEGEGDCDCMPGTFRDGRGWRDAMPTTLLSMDPGAYNWCGPRPWGSRRFE